MKVKEKIIKEIWENIRNIIHKYEITCGEDIYQASRVQDSTADILHDILIPLLNELEKIDVEEFEKNKFDINKLIRG